MTLSSGWQNCCCDCGCDCGCGYDVEMMKSLMMKMAVRLVGIESEHRGVAVVVVDDDDVVAAVADGDVNEHEWSLVPVDERRRGDKPRRLQQLQQPRNDD